MKNLNMSKIISSLIYIALGLVIIVYPELIGDTICYMLAGAAVVMGIINIIAYLMTTVETRVTQNTNGLASGIILFLLGIFIIIEKKLVISLIPFILGFMIALKGVIAIQNAINIKRLGFGSFKGSLLTAVLVMIFGIVMMLNPFSTAQVLFIMIGIGLTASGIIDIISTVIINRQLKKNSNRE